MIEKVIRIAEKASQIILDIYNNSDNFQTEIKDDNSPVTIADKKGGDYICQELTTHFVNIPIVCEENPETHTYEYRQSLELFWLVDPLDGTKEFIKKNGEFTVNIALIKGTRPILGVVTVPTMGLTYYTENGKTSYIRKFGQYHDDAQCIHVASYPHNPLVVSGSRSHANKETSNFVNNTLRPIYSNIKTISSGSSLKLLLVSLGEVDIYPRMGPTREWDTAAAHAVVLGAGGIVRSYPDISSELQYRKKDLLNPYFIVMTPSVANHLGLLSKEKQ